MATDDEFLNSLFKRVTPIGGPTYIFGGPSGGKSWLYDLWINSDRYKTQEQAYVDAAVSGDNSAFQMWIDEAGDLKLERVDIFADPAVIADLTETECPWGGSPLAAPQEEYHGRPQKPRTP